MEAIDFAGYVVVGILCGLFAVALFVIALCLVSIADCLIELRDERRKADAAPDVPYTKDDLQGSRFDRWA